MAEAKSGRRSGRTRTPERVLDELADVRDKLLENEEDRRELQTRRNKLILEARGMEPDPPTLVEVARVAGVGNSYVSRIERDKGKPLTGHQNDARKKAVA